jgi:hypothetical protein
VIFAADTIADAIVSRLNNVTNWPVAIRAQKTYTPQQAVTDQPGPMILVHPITTQIAANDASGQAELPTIGVTVAQQVGYAEQQDTISRLLTIRQKVRETLARFPATTWRVDQIDADEREIFETKALDSWLLFFSTVQVDCFMVKLREDQPDNIEANNSTLLAIKRGFWSALNGWNALDGLFTRRYSTAEAEQRLRLGELHACDLPAMALVWGESQPKNETYQHQRWPTEITVRCWLKTNQHDLALTLPQKIVDAVFKEKPNSTSLPYVRAASGGTSPTKNSPISVSNVEIGRGQTKCIQVDVSFTVALTHDPYPAT